MYRFGFMAGSGDGGALPWGTVVVACARVKLRLGG